ncbi:hypothetical protein BA896_011000 [Janthinobacterium lividum]|uniref:Uncharacterized protein n=1 Tax=Janthinobacterium lividum TaxID=29581 RepID=A0A1E8PSW8_9BURK|nr:hypothetical protein BA896_011000 [Janthinobacterium lividum]
MAKGTEGSAAGQFWHEKRLAGINFSDDSISVARPLSGLTVMLDGVGGRSMETPAYEGAIAPPASLGAMREGRGV